MNEKRHKLRLRKQVIYSIPVFLVLVILSLALIIGNSGITNEVLKKEILSALKLNDEPENTFKLSDLKYIKEFTDYMEKRQKDNTIIYYAQLHKLDIDKTLEIAYEYTDTYKDEEFNKNFVIGPDKVKAKAEKFNSFEAGVVYFVRDLYRYPEKYGSSISEMRLDESPTLKEVSTDGEIYMDNGLTYEQYMGQICDLFEVDKEFVLAIARLESGNGSSYLFKAKNNIGGHRGLGGTWKTYTTLEAGVISHVLTVKTIAKNSGVDIKEATDEEIAIVSGKYVNGSVNNPSPSWTQKVTNLKRNIETRDLFTIKK